MTLFVFLIILSILIVVHEWGHFIIAKKCGVKVEQFSLGFGPKLFSRIWDGTEFCLCLIPLGGYVKMAGDDRSKATGNKEEFLSKPVGQKALIVVMGPVVNHVLAYFCFWMVFVIGKIDLEATAKRVPAIAAQILDNSPASKAGIMINDKVISIDNHPIANWPDLQDYILQSKTPTLKIFINRHGETITKEIVPEYQIKKDIFGRDHKIRGIGIVARQEDKVIIRYGPLKSLWYAAKELGDITIKTYVSLYEMVIGKRSPKEAMGILGMFSIIKDSLSVSFSFLLYIIGLISASLALFNLLPIIPLDGGHLFLFLLEKIRGKALSHRIDEFISKVGLTLILTLALFIFYVDFERIGLIDHIMKIFRG